MALQIKQFSNTPGTNLTVLILQIVMFKLLIHYPNCLCWGGSGGSESRTFHKLGVSGLDDIHHITFSVSWKIIYRYLFVEHAQVQLPL